MFEARHVFERREAAVARSPRSRPAAARAARRSSCRRAGCSRAAAVRPSRSRASARPMRVTRGSFSDACTAPVIASASGRIDRNFSASNGRPPRPDALLPIEDRPAVFELDRRGDRHPQRRGQRKADARERGIEARASACCLPRLEHRQLFVKRRHAARGARPSVNSRSTRCAACVAQPGAQPGVSHQRRERLARALRHHRRSRPVRCVRADSPRTLRSARPC